MRLKYKFAFQQITDFWAAVPVGEDAKVYHGVVSLNETSKDMMQFLADDITKTELVALMQQQYDVPADKLLADVETFLTQLRDEQLLIE